MLLVESRGGEMLSPVARMIVGGADVAKVMIGGLHQAALIAGPCVIESEALVGRICEQLIEICRPLGLPLIFKASFDKANRSSAGSFRGPGLDEGLAILRRLRARHGVAITTDIHLPEQAAPVAEVVDLIQIPAFLCRQTDLLLAAGKTGKPINLKKGQFLAPWDVSHAVGKLAMGGAAGVMITERGSSFGYNNLVVDMRALPTIRGLGVPVCFDATHSVQQPGALGDRSGGDRSMVPFLARAAVAAGVDAIFIETHEDPESALSDGPNMVPLDEMPALLAELVAIDRLVKNR
jgi:2-dehydro-3-deoxyphosphooctonate aldolase (KDO 8-P synthase)